MSVGPQSLARRWSQALHAHPAAPDGIEYRCRHNADELAFALFDRVGEAALRPVDAVALTADLAWLSQMRTRHHIWRPPT